MKKPEIKIQAEFPPGVLEWITRIQSRTDLSPEDILNQAVNAGLSLVEVRIASKEYFPVREEKETSLQYKKRLSAYLEKHRDSHSKKAKLILYESEIWVSYILFLESPDGHPKRFVWRCPETGRVVATHKEISALQEKASDVYLLLKEDIESAQELWSARWQKNVEEVAKGGSIQALEWLMSRDHRWNKNATVPPDLKRLAEMFAAFSSGN